MTRIKQKLVNQIHYINQSIYFPEMDGLEMFFEVLILFF